MSSDVPEKATLQSLIERGPQRKKTTFRKDMDGVVRRYTHRGEGAGNKSPSKKFKKREKTSADECAIVASKGYRKKPRHRKYEYVHPSLVPKIKEERSEPGR